MLCTTTWAPSTPGWGLHPSAARTQRRGTVSFFTTTQREKACRTLWSASLKPSLSKSTAQRSRWRSVAFPFFSSLRLFTPVLWHNWGDKNESSETPEKPVLLAEVRVSASCLSQRMISGSRSLESLEMIQGVSSFWSFKQVSGWIWQLFFFNDVAFSRYQWFYCFHSFGKNYQPPEPWGKKVTNWCRYFVH